MPLTPSLETLTAVWKSIKSGEGLFASLPSTIVRLGICDHGIDSASTLIGLLRFLQQAVFDRRIGSDIGGTDGCEELDRKRNGGDADESQFKTLPSLMLIQLPEWFPYAYSQKYLSETSNFLKERGVRLKYY